MDTAALKKFAQSARRSLMEQVSAKLAAVLAQNSPARRENPKAVEELEKALESRGREQVVERVAYTWFNRFCALRFMDANHYSPVGVVSPAAGQTQPEILAEAKMGHIDEDIVTDAAARERIFALLRGSVTSNDPQAEAYRLLLVVVCNHWHKTMPFMFERIHDYAELLMPDDLLSESSVLSQTREAMTEENCKDVEVIGWLYQFCISEKKDAVFEGLKKNKKVTPENIPAATQLFTPHWIVRYLVENSLGRLWMLNRPNSGLAAKMEYYIKPEQPEADFLRVNLPEEIKICDPACGSGHMLTYAFDLLHAIYEEEGYAPSDIPAKILTHNLYGVEIDERAGALAAFALAMKARARQRGFFRKPVQPRICVLQNISFTKDELAHYMDFAGRDLFTAPLVIALHQFEEADNFGSLIRPEITDATGMRKILERKDIQRQILLDNTHQKVLRVLEQSEYLSSRYHVVIANPPYMGGKGMNNRLGAWAKDNYPNSKSDLFAMFIERNRNLVKQNGYSAQITMESWMFLSSYEKLRAHILGTATIQSLGHFPYDGKRPTVMGINFGTTAFILRNSFDRQSKGYFFCSRHHELLNNGHPIVFPTKNERSGSASAADFKKIPGSPIAYWVSEKIREIFSKTQPLSASALPRQGLATSDNNRFLRQWHEPCFYSICFECKSKKEAKNFAQKWFPYSKGGGYRKWFGNDFEVVNWQNDGQELIEYATSLYKSPTRTIKNIPFYFLPAATWGLITSANFSCRYRKPGYVFDVGGMSAFVTSGYLQNLVAFLNTKIASLALKIINPTLNYQVGDISKLPLKESDLHDTTLLKIVSLCIGLSQSDWDSYETSWDFTTLPLLQPEYRQPILAATYSTLRAHWRDMTIEMQRLEEENNRIFIEAYGLQDELTPEVPLKEITLTCNPHYRYNGGKTEEELEAMLLADTMKEFISYAVGCMFGRYALEKPGLVLANQGETIADYRAQIPNPSFPADDDNVIPMLDGDWFTDDITGRFREFLRVTFGEEHYEENLSFIEKALGKDIRKYFTKDFYNDHVRRYKKRPIYWLFSSPRGSFNALIYMHRYRPDTVSVVLNDYLREFQTKLAAEKTRLEHLAAAASASPAEKTKALKALEQIRKSIKELEDYERDTLYPLATRQIAIDLDDGVKVNYPKFGEALKKIPGLDVAE